MSAPWRVHKGIGPDFGERPWLACDRGGWFGAALPGKCFRTHGEAFRYAAFMAQFLTELQIILNKADV